jgi:two-component system, LytTR family, sensor kinase
VVVIFLLLSAPFSLVHTFIAGAFLYPFPQIWWSPFRDHDYIIYYFLGGWAIYGALVGALQALRYHDRYLTGRLHLERVEKSLLQSRLQALRLHLEPHFLFNALNSISSEVEQDPELAREMISDLGALLRQSLECQDKSEIPLSRELALLDHYLSIQKIRFGDRMNVKLEIEPDTLSAEVPSMLLQPLIENAIRHGIERKRTGGRIIISASKVGTELQLSVADNGPGLPRDWTLERSIGHGLRVTLERLAAIYPDLASECLSIGRRARGGTQVMIRIPLRANGQDEPNG